MNCIFVYEIWKPSWQETFRLNKLRQVLQIFSVAILYLIDEIGFPPYSSWAQEVLKSAPQKQRFSKFISVITFVNDVINNENNIFKDGIGVYTV